MPLAGDSRYEEAGCSSCQSENKKQEAAAVYHDYDDVVQDFTAGVAHIQALHHQSMYALNGGEYDWRNSKVTSNDTITAETIDELHIIDVTNMFQLFAPAHRTVRIDTRDKRHYFLMANP